MFVNMRKKQAISLIYELLLKRQGGLVVRELELHSKFLVQNMLLPLAGFVSCLPLNHHHAL